MSSTVLVNPQPTVPSFDATMAPCPVTPPTNPYVTVEKFRADFTAFADPEIYPDTSVQYFLDIAGIMVNPARWCQLTTLGMELITAHFLSLQRYSMLRAGGASGAGVPGVAMGLMSSKSVSKVSVGYDNAVTAIEGGGPWNYTIYGQQYLYWAMLAGTGGYETLAVANAEASAGVVNTWARGVMIGWSGGA